ncbi:MAG: hypothetical protein GY786_01000 [Proteobacteria bacterium]|nr:hypothetical protein [Pseudomonadota bacterium]
MSDFLDDPDQIEDLLRLWKATLLTEEAIQKTLFPVPPNVALIEGRNYFKHTILDKNRKFSDFLLGNISSLSIPIEKEQLPFLKYLKDQDNLSRKFRQPIEHDFIIGFPALYYNDRQGKEKLTTLFKFPLHELEYPTLPDNLDSMDLNQKNPNLPSIEMKQELDSE